MNEQSQIGTGKGLHVAIIMDGNGRWAKERGRPRLFGHHAGAKRAREVVEACPDLGVTHITLFAFSTENWKRTQAEVAGLMSLFRRYINKTAHELNDEGACVRFIGDRIKLDPKLRRLMDDPGHVDGVIADGAGHARAIAEPILAEVHDILGFLRPGRG